MASMAALKAFHLSRFAGRQAVWLILFSSMSAAFVVRTGGPYCGGSWVHKHSPFPTTTPQFDLQHDSHGNSPFICSRASVEALNAHLSENSSESGLKRMLEHFIVSFRAIFRRFTRGWNKSPKTVEVECEEPSDTVETERIPKTTATFVSTGDGSRRATAASTTDLSGVWTPIVTQSFKNEYDEYLKKCGEGFMFRKTLLSVIGIAKEVVDQRSGGRELSITGSTPIGGWERVLVASGASDGEDTFEPIFTTFADPDGDVVNVEAWWEDTGTVHKSWLRNKPRVCGGEFESSRYIEKQSNGDLVLVCKSVFHPPPGNPKFQKASVVWRFKRS